MVIGIPTEVHPGEHRVAATPESVIKLRDMGFDCIVEAGAGSRADAADAAYVEAGARIIESAEALWAEADIVLKVRAPEANAALGRHEADLIKEGATLISFIWPAQNMDLLEQLAARRVTVLAMDCVPRITRAQKLDALSAMANIGGHRAIIEAAHAFPSLFTGQVTAAGRIAPAKVFVIGAGVAGLAAIAGARGLGAIVRAFDSRPEVADQVRSMGAEYVRLDFEEQGGSEGGYATQMSDAFIKAEQELIAKQALEVDIIVTTALIPGRRAPELITAGVVESMKPGSVIVDLAAEQGGNCALTQPGKLIVHKGVKIIGYTDLPSRMATLASRLYAANIVSFLEELGNNDTFHIDIDDDVVRGALVLHDGEITWPPPRPSDYPEEPAEPTKRRDTAAPLVEDKVQVKAAAKKDVQWGVASLAACALAFIAIGAAAPEGFVTHFLVFVLACFVGWQVVWNVTPALHTPLMSVTNAISGIIIIGGMLQLSGAPLAATTLLGALAVLVATINISGGFLVTNRMLAMFRK
jgi:NAD(P) transhydrogenase subunit alpha